MRQQRASAARRTAFRYAATCLLVVIASPAAGAQFWSSPDGERYLIADAALKWTTLMSHAPQAPLLYPERWSGASLWRGRLTLGGQPTSGLHLRAAYEQRARTVSAGAGASGGVGILAPEGRAPYRVAQADAALVTTGQTLSYRHELDRCLIAAPLGRAELQIGRQAIGWGRGVLFGAVDIFAPFSPLESDREWRRGVDALRLSLPLSDLISLEAVAALGEDIDASAFVTRLHGYVGDVDGELLLGRRRRDRFAGAALSAPFMDAELHGEIAAFNTPEALAHGVTFGRDDLTLKTVIGGSYGWDARDGALLVGEYHFSGFGLDEVEEVGARLQDPAYRERLLLGDSQILGRHAAALQLSWGLGGDWPSTLGWIISPADGSGVLTAVSSWICADDLTLAATLYVPYGDGPSGGALRSEYGGTPASGLIQISFYY